jgi:hypothetical protein
MLVKDELERMWKKVVSTYFNIQTQQFSVEAEKSQNNYVSIIYKYGNKNYEPGEPTETLRCC